jgi:hypothetical protein
MMLAQWLVNELGSGSIADYVTLPERYLWAKIAVAAGAPKTEADYISLPKQYVWKAIYDAVSGSSAGTIDWGEKQALGHIAAAYRGDTANPANLATYIDWPWRYQVASIINALQVPPTPEFSPSDIDDLVLWLDGSDSSTMFDATSGGNLVAVNSPIARLEDKSGNENHATQSVLNNRPLRKDLQLNGLDGIEFDGSNDVLRGGNLITGEFSVFAVVKFSGSTEVGAYFTQDSSSLPTLYRHGTGQKLRIFDGTDLDSVSTINLTNWYILGNVRNSTNKTIYVNGSLDATALIASGSMGGNYGIGSWVNGGQFQAMTLAEIIVYNRSLLSSELEEIHTYLNEKWGVY